MNACGKLYFKFLKLNQAAYASMLGSKCLQVVILVLHVSLALARSSLLQKINDLFMN